MKKIFIILASVAGVFSASSCGKQLEVTPPNKIYEEQIVEIMNGNDEAKKELVINALASPMIKYFNYWGGAMPGGVLAPMEYCYQGIEHARSLQGNDMVMGRSRAQTMDLAGRSYYSGEIAQELNNNSTNANWAHWFGYAYAINQANLLLKYMPENAKSGKNSIMSARMRGLVVRAYSYMCLMEEYAKPFKAGTGQLGMSIYTKYDPNQTPVARSSADSTWNFIINDLKQADKFIDTLVMNGAISNDGFTTGYAELEDFDKGVVNFLLARAYILSNQWQKAIDACDVLIKSGAYSFIKAANYGCNPGGETLPSVPSQIKFEPQNNAFTALKKNPECILGYIKSSSFNPRTQSDRAGVQTMLQNPFGTYSGSGNTVLIDNQLYEKIQSNDVRKNAFYQFSFDYIFPGASESINVPGYSAMKYGATCGLQDDGVTAGQKDEVDNQDFCKFRYSEVILMKAEAQAQLGKKDDVINTLKPLLVARGTTTSSYNMSGTLADVQLQYRIEMWGENGREYFNNKRWGINIDRSNSKNHWAQWKFTSTEVDMTLLIPNKEIETNPYCQQN